jgi:hypothetical protein
MNNVIEMIMKIIWMMMLMMMFVTPIALRMIPEVVILI